MTHAHAHLSRRQLLALCALSLAVPSVKATGLADRAAGWLSGNKGRLVVVLVDTSSSITADDGRLYESALQAVLKGIKPGDRIVLGEVADRPAPRFVAHADHRFTAGGNSLHDKARARRTGEAVLADFATLRSNRTRPAQSTLLLDTVLASSELLAEGRSRGQTLQLVLLSDMVEESRERSFARAAPTADQTARIVESLRRNGLLPNLADVQVHAVGAAGRDAAHMASVQAFWRSYFTSAGADLRTYGRSAGGLEP